MFKEIWHSLPPDYIESIKTMDLRISLKPRQKKDENNTLLKISHKEKSLKAAKKKTHYIDKDYNRLVKNYINKCIF